MRIHKIHAMKLYESLNIRRDEVLPVSLFIFQSVFLGIFLGAFDVGANTLFLNTFDSSMISKAFAVSGMVGIILTSLYTFFQKRISFSSLSIINLLTVFLITFLLRFGYYFTDTKWLAFGMFVMMGPLNIVALVGFWGTVSRIFDLRQGKRIFGIIDTGQVIGVILASWAVPFLVENGFKTNNLLYISAVSIFISFGFQVYISSAFPDKLKVKSAAGQKSSRFTDTIKVPYIRTMALFVVFSMLVAFFVHYLFLAVAKTRFENPDELAKFLGGLMGTLTFVSILVKSFVYGNLMNNYGLRVTLLISPVIMAFLIIIAAFVGSFFGYTLESASFTFFFLVISLGKLFQKVLKDSVESPSLKMLYQSLDPSVRYEVQARVDGTVNEIAALFSGILLTLFSLLSFFLLIHYTFILILIIGVWGLITVYLYRGYRKTLQVTLMGSIKSEKTAEPEYVLQTALNPDSFSEQLAVIESSKPWNLIPALTESLSTASKPILSIALAKIRELGKTVLLPEIEKLRSVTKDKEINKNIDETVNHLKSIREDSQNVSKIRQLIGSRDFSDRVHAARLIGASENPEIKNSLTFLMRDLVPAVKKQAIRAACGTNSREIISFLIDFLDKDQYAPLAHAALIGSGDAGLEMLELALQKTNITDTFRDRVLRIMPETGSSKSGTTLFNRFSIKSHERQVVLDGLLRLNFTTDSRGKASLNPKIIEQAGICAWNLNAFYYCPHHSKIPFLKDELEREFQKSIHFLFNILKLSYDRNSIEAVKENLDAGTGQSISFAVELLDTFMDEDIKPYIIPLLEDTSLSNKIWALENYFPLRVYQTDSMIKAILNRDNNLIGKQAKIFALNAFRHLENPTASADLIAQLFNTDKVLRLISAQILEEIDRTHYLNCKKRLSDKLRVELDKQISLFQLTGLSATDRINFYKTLFGGKTDERDILFLLYQSTAIRLDETDIFEMEIFKDKAYLVFIESGEVRLTHTGKEFSVYGPGEFINTSGINKTPWKLETARNTLIHYIELSRLAASLYDNEHLIKYIGQHTSVTLS